MKESSYTSTTTQKTYQMNSKRMKTKTKTRMKKKKKTNLKLKRRKKILLKKLKIWITLIIWKLILLAAFRRLLVQWSCLLTSRLQARAERARNQRKRRNQWQQLLASSQSQQLLQWKQRSSSWKRRQHAH